MRMPVINRILIKPKSYASSLSESFVILFTVVDGIFLLSFWSHLPPKFLVVRGKKFIWFYLLWQENPSTANFSSVTVTQAVTVTTLETAFYDAGILNGSCFALSYF